MKTKNNSQSRYKVRLVVKGFGQKKGVDFKEIFSPVVKMSSIRVVLGLAASLILKIEQLNVHTTFLHGDLEEEIYVEQPERFSVKDKEELVHKKFNSFMENHSFNETMCDHCVFMKKFSDNDFIILLLYVDDMLIIG